MADTIKGARLEFSFSSVRIYLDANVLQYRRGHKIVREIHGRQAIVAELRTDAADHARQFNALADSLEERAALAGAEAPRP